MKSTPVLFRIILPAILLAVAVALPGLTPAAFAQEGIVSEMRVGLLAHDVDALSFNRESGADVNLEVLFTSPDLLQAIGAPRPHLGTSVNTSGDTSILYTGLTWHWELMPRLFTEAHLGGAVHNGKIISDDPGRKSLGSRALFRLGLSVGYDLTERYNASLIFDHVSNAGLGSANEGMDSVGLRIGYKF